jgi:hypothetical protein
MNESTKQNYGYLQINVTSSDGAIPISDATVAVRLIENGVPRIIAVLLTDESGQTPEIIIENAVARAFSRSGAATSPYATVDIETTAFGYYSTANVQRSRVPRNQLRAEHQPDTAPRGRNKAACRRNVIVFESEAPSL